MGSKKRGILICFLLIALTISPVYAFSFSGFYDSLRGLFGLQTKPQTSVSLSGPEVLNTELGEPATFILSINNTKGSANIRITGSAYLDGKLVEKIDKSIEMEKKSSEEVEVYEVAPSNEYAGDWKLDIEVEAVNDRGSDSKNASTTFEVISPPEINLKIDNLKSTYRLSRGETEKISPTIIVENTGGKANFNVNFVIKHDGQVIKKIPKTFELKKGEKFQEMPYFIELNRGANEGIWEFVLDASAENIAGLDEAKVETATKVTAEPILTVTRELEKEKMRRGEKLEVTVIIENMGFKDALSVSFDDVFPQNFELISGNNSFQGTVKGGGKITLTYVVSPQKKGLYTFPELTVYYDGELTTGLTAKSNTNTVEVFGIPDIEITREFSKSEIVKGDSTTVTIKISNKGDGLAKKVSFSDEIPIGVTFVSGSYSVNEDISPEFTREISYVVKVENKGQYTFPALSLSYYDELEKKYTSEVSATTLVVYGIPELTVIRSLASNKMRRGENLKVTVSIQNIGDADAIDASFEDILPTKFNLVSGSKSWNEKIGEGETKTFSYYVKPLQKGEYTFPEVTVFYAGILIPGLTTKSNTNSIQVFGIPKLKLTRSFSKDEILKGDSTTVTIKISNEGDGIAKSTSFSEKIPGGSIISGTSSITEVDIVPGTSKQISYTVKIYTKGEYRFPAIAATHLDELLDLWYQPTVSSNILIVYGIPSVQYVNPSISSGDVVGDTTKLYLTLKNNGDGIAKNVEFSYSVLPVAFKYYAGSSSWSGNLNPGQSKYIEYNVENDDEGTFEVSQAYTSYNDELGNPYSMSLNPISITVLGSKKIGSGLKVVFDEWASDIVPRIGISNTEYDYWQYNPNHRPKWYYRIVLNENSKEGIIQFFARWPDQYHDWPESHKYDTEPIWIYFTYTGSNWKSATLYMIKYTKGHSKVSSYSTSQFSWYNNHPLFRLKSGHHAYDGGSLDTGTDGGIRMYHLDTNIYKLTDKIINEWNGYTPNPFIQYGSNGAVYTVIFENPSSLTDCFKLTCDNMWTYIGFPTDDGTEDSIVRALT